MSDGGKGDSRRPMAISDQQYAQRWDLIFGKDRDEKTSRESSGDNQERVGLAGSNQLHGGRHIAPEIGGGNEGQTAQ